MKNVIHLIYETAHSPEKWPKLLEALYDAHQIDFELAGDSGTREGLNSHLDLAHQIVTKQAILNGQVEVLQSLLERIPYGLFQTTPCVALNQAARRLPVEIIEILYNFCTRTQLTHQRMKIDHQGYFLLKIPESNLVCVATTSYDEINQSELFVAWRLTAKEIEVCKKLLQGEKLNDIAEQHNRSIHTLRNQLKSILSKSGCHSQQDLVREFYQTSLSTQISPKPHTVDHPALRTLLLEDGRTLAWAESGVPDGVPVVLCHNIFQSRWCRHYDESIVEALNIRLIVPDRPGFGQSTPHPGATAVEWSWDLKVLLDHLSIEKVPIIGMGASCNFALASAYEIPDRITKVVLANTGFFIFDPIIFECENKKIHQFVFGLAKNRPKLLAGLTKMVAKGLFFSNPFKLIKAFEPSDHLLDRKLMKDVRFRKLLIDDFAEAHRQGLDQSIINELHVLAKYGRNFDVHKIKQRVVIYHSTDSETPPIKQVEQLVLGMENAVLYPVQDKGIYIAFHLWATLMAESVS